MSSNLTNVYAYLRKSYPDVDMLFAKPPSYIKVLAGAEKAIFVFKEVNSRILCLTASRKVRNFV